MDKIKEVKERANIVEVARYLNIHLNYANKACCPFHKEKTASFSISTSKQIYKCFGCGKGGDVISLVSEMININALEAAKLINDICNCGVDLKQSVSKYEIEKYNFEQKKKADKEKYINEQYDKLCWLYREVNNILKKYDIKELYILRDKVEYLFEVLENEPEKYKEVAKIWKT